MHREQLDTRRDEKKRTKFLCEISDASWKIFEFLTHRSHYSEFFIGPTRAPFLLRPSVSRREGGTFGMPGEPRERTRDRYCLDLVTVVVGLISTRSDKKQRGSSPHRVASSRSSHYYSPWNSSARGDAMGRGSRCTGATDRSLPFPRQGFLVFHGFFFFFVFSFFVFSSPL